MNVPDLVSKLRACVPAEQHDAAAAINKIWADLAYTAPELHVNFPQRLFTEFIVPHVAPRDTEAWTNPIHDLWAAHFPPREERKRPKSATKKGIAIG